MIIAGTDYKQHWDEKFRTRRWGRYPPEDLVRFIMRNYAQNPRSAVSVLEVGCGPGANLWFLHREGFRVFGIDGSVAAIEAAKERLEKENEGLNPLPFDLRQGDFQTLPWPEASFDVVIDVFALYANRIAVIQRTVNEISRVLKPGGRFYSKLWGRRTCGFGGGQEVEVGTFDMIPSGPCADMGVTHFFDLEEIRRVFGVFEAVAIDSLTRSDLAAGHELIEEIHCHFRKPGCAG